MTAEKLPRSPIAIVGMAARLPGAPNLDSFWNLIRSGGVGYGPVSDEFLDRELYFHPDRGTRGKAYTTLAGLVPHVPREEQTFKLDEELFARTEPGHITYLETAAEAFRSAGYDPLNLPTRKVGVYVGHAKGSSTAAELAMATKMEEVAAVLRSTPGFDQLPAAEQQRLTDGLVTEARAMRPKRKQGKQPLFGASHLPALLADIFGLDGPYLSLDAACASSLLALALGVMALDRGDIEMALVGGASMIRGDVLVIFCQAQTCSAFGSYPFDSRADGMVPSDGYTAVVLKTLEKAQADGDNILGVIRGVGISSDGKGKSLWAPRKEGQKLAMERAYGTWHNPTDTQYIECHATATQVGDATELEALREFMNNRVPLDRKIPIGSVKANIGHTLESAGVSGLIKVLLAMKHGVFPVTPYQTLNDSIPWNELPFRVSNVEQPWPQPAGRPRRAGVNAFGIGGLNVHVIVEEAPPAGYEVSKNGSNGHHAPQVKEEPGIAIVGRGVVLPSAFNMGALWDLMRSGADPKSEVSDRRWSKQLYLDPTTPKAHRVMACRGGFIQGWEYDWKRHRIPPKQLACSSPLQYMLLDAVEQAINEAKLELPQLRAARTSVVVGGGFAGEFGACLTVSIRIPELERIVRRFLKQQGAPQSVQDSLPAAFSARLLEVFPGIFDETGSFTSSTLASRISKHFDLTGGALAMESGESSALSALMLARNLLESHTSDYVVCAVGNRALDPVDFESISLSGNMALGKVLSPFDDRFAGTVPCEGAGALLLKRYADAKRDGNQIYGVIRGMGVAFSARQGSEAIAKASRQAYTSAKLRAADIGVIEVAGTGEPARALADLQGLEAGYRDGSREKPIELSTGVAQLGTLQSAQGIVALLRASMSVEHGELLPTVGLEKAHPLCSQPSTLLHPNASPQPFPIGPQPQLRAAGVSAVSERGLALHAIVESGERSAVPAAAPPATPIAAAAPHAAAPPIPAAVSERFVPGSIPQTVSSRFTQPSSGMSAMIQSTGKPSARRKFVRVRASQTIELIAKLEQVIADPQSYLDRADSVAFLPGDRHRVVLLAETAAELAQRAQLAVKHNAQPELMPWLIEQGVFIGSPGAQPLRAAFVFAGQGSQYPGMIRELVAQDHAARESLSQCEQTLNRLGCDSFEQIAWRESERLGTEVWATQVGVLTADLVFFQAISARGLRPAVVTGHSYGEYPALVAAGVWSYEQAVQATTARCQAIEASRSGPGVLLSTSATVHEIERVLNELKVQAYIANYNAPGQTIVGGTPAAIDQLEAALAAGGARVKRLNVPRAFHTPLLADAQPALRESLRSFALRPGRLPILSSITNRYEADPESIRQNLVAQLTEPVRYPELITRLINDGVGLLVEIGPKQVLTGLHRAILQEAGNTQVLCVATDHAKQPGPEMLDKVQALWECLGGEITGGHGPAVRPSNGAIKKPAPTATPNASTPVHFDATVRRKENLKRANVGETKHAAEPVKREKATNGVHPEPVLVGATVAPEPVAPAPVAPSPVVAKPAPAPMNFAPAKPAPAVAPLPEPVVVVQAATAPVQASPAKSAKGPGGEDLEKFLVQFVVDQTGYPPEFVELDADLEADLGIDSIKKAQLFGELSDHFDVAPSTANANLTLDQFPTLRHIVEFLKTVPRRDGSESSVVATAAAPAPTVTMTAAIAPAAIEAVATAPVVTAPKPVAPIAPLAPVQPAPVALAPAEPAPAVPAPSGEAIADLEKFLVQFVVDQTGYPPEFVELDADLEADLGIDSIKKAQLFGELSDHFEVAPSTANANLTLDQFPTLRHIVEFLKTVPRRGEAAPAALAAPAPVAAITPPAPVAASAPPVVASPAPAAPVAVAPPAPAPVASVAAVTEARSSTELADLEKFLVQFVVDQTGYPPEFVELDADLEADLGIDSIKKAQLFGELGDHFEVAPSTANANLTLDQFPTLRHIVEFLKTVPRRGDAPAAAAAPAVIAPVPTPAPKPAPQAAPVAPAPAEPEFVPSIVAEIKASKPTAKLAPPVAPVAAAPMAPVVPAAPTQPASAAPAPTGAAVTTSRPWEENTRDKYQPPAGDLFVYRRAPRLPAAPTPISERSSLGRRALRLEGELFDMGLQQATAWKEELPGLLQRWISGNPTGEQLAAQIQTVGSGTKWLGHEGVLELRGLAESLGLPLHTLIAWNLALEAYQPAVFAAANVDPKVGAELVLGVNGGSTPFTDAEFAAITRTQPNGKSVTLFGLPGQLGALAGCNSRGVSIVAVAGSGDADSTVDKGQASYGSGTLLVRATLEEANSLDEAIAYIGSKPLTGPWTFFVGDTVAGRAVRLEHRASRWTQAPVESLQVAGTAEQQSACASAWATSAPGVRPLALLPEGANLVGVALSVGPRRVEARLSTDSTTAADPIFKRAWNFAELDVPMHHACTPTNTRLAELPAEDARVSSRYTVKVSPVPLKGEQAMTWNGSAIVLGENLYSRELVRRLGEQGVTSYVLNPYTPIDQLLAAIDQICESGPAPHLFLMQGRDAAAHCELRHEPWQARKHAGLLAPMAVTQRWHQLTHKQKILDHCSVAAAVSLGGDFGQSGAVAFEGAGISGMLKSLWSEMHYGGVPSFKAKVVDSPETDSPELVVDQLLRELASTSRGLEICYRDGQRGVVRIQHVPASTLPKHPVPRGGVWVVTGGARGVTSVAVRELAARFGWKLHLLGLSPQPEVNPQWLELDAEGTAQLKLQVLNNARAAGQVPAAAWGKVERAIEIARNLQTMARAGVQATYHHCDVSDFAQVEPTLAAIRAKDGPIHGIVHGAGYEMANLFTKKKWETILSTINPKADGTIALLEATRNDPLECFIGYGSVSGLAGGPGQADYSMGNYLLTNMIQRIRNDRQGCQAFAVHWSAFDGVGMATRPESRHALEKMGSGFMSPEEGAAHLVDELEHGMPQSQIAVCEPRGKVATIMAEQGKDAVVNAAAAATLQTSNRVLPMIDSFSRSAANDSLVASLEFNPREDNFLWQHRLYGKPLLPAVMSLEAFLEAAELLSGRAATSLRDVSFASGLVVPEDQTRKATVTVRRTAGGLACQLTADFLDNKGRVLQKDRLISSAIVECDPNAAPLQPWTVKPPVVGTFPIEYLDFAPVFHGPPFRRLRRSFHQFDGGFCLLEAESLDAVLGARGSVGARLPAAVLDGTFFACGTFIFWMFEARADLPHSVEKLQLGRLPKPGEKVTLRFFYRGSEGPHMKFDFQAVGEDGGVLYQAEGYRSINLSQGWK